MPTYRYLCPCCKGEFDIIKRIAQCDEIEVCPHCKEDGIDKHHRQLGTPVFFGEKQEESFFSIPLGKMVSGKTEMRKIAKERGMIEVGNENIDKLCNESDNYREQKSKERYAEFSKPIEING